MVGYLDGKVFVRSFDQLRLEVAVGYREDDLTLLSKGAETLRSLGFYVEDIGHCYKICRAQKVYYVPKDVLHTCFAVVPGQTYNSLTLQLTELSTFVVVNEFIFKSRITSTMLVESYIEAQNGKETTDTQGS